MPGIDPSRYQKPKPPFGRWLVTQIARPDAVGELAKAAKGDARFPLDGNFEAISRRLNELQADPEMHIALEEAELDWACL